MFCVNLLDLVYFQIYLIQLFSFEVETNTKCAYLISLQFKFTFYLWRISRMESIFNFLNQ